MRNTAAQHRLRMRYKRALQNARDERGRKRHAHGATVASALSAKAKSLALQALASSAFGRMFR